MSTNFHTVRLKDIDGVPVGRFRRRKGGKIGNVAVPESVHILWVTEQGTTEEQAVTLYFPGSWPLAGVRAWLKDTGLKYKSLKKATGKQKKLDKARQLHVDLSMSNASRVKGGIFDIGDNRHIF